MKASRSGAWWCTKLILKVVDTNSLDSYDLKEFLERSRHHAAVLTEWPVIEALNGIDPISSLKKRFAICESNRSQFLLAKEAATLARLRGRQAGLAKRIIDPESSATLVEFLAIISKAARGDNGAARAILRKKSEAEDFLDRFLKASGDFTIWYSVFEKEYSKADLDIIRKRKPYNKSIWTKMTRTVRDLTGFFLAGQDGTVIWPRPAELPNTFCYRLALMLQLHFFDWVASGSPQERKAEGYRNDQIDIFIGATATYFDGLITNDKKLRRMYDDAVWFLEHYSKPLAHLVESKRRAANN